MGAVCKQGEQAATFGDMLLPMAKILLCQVEGAWRGTLTDVLRSAGHEVVVADGANARERVRDDRYDLILTALRMPEVDGFELMAMARQHVPHTPVIAMSDNAEIPDAIKALHAGACDFLIMPFDARILVKAVAAALCLRNQSQDRSDPLDWRDRNARWLLGADPAILTVLSRLARVAGTQCALLITGESGTGKELAARSLHAGSARSSKPFVVVNCAELPKQFVDSELFGQARGAFAGAEARRGRFEEADGGTIFLDEIGEMEMAVQAKLLRLIETGQFIPVGEVRLHNIDVRIVAATRHSLDPDVEAGRFRADLYWRLNTIPIQMPTLRSRVNDIVCLSEYFLARANERHRRQVTSIDPQTMALMKSYWWPGNIRELEDLVERMVIAKGSGVLMPSDLTCVGPLAPPTPGGDEPAPQPPERAADLNAILEAVEEKMIADAIVRTGGSKSRVAESLRLNRTTAVDPFDRRGSISQRRSSGAEPDRFHGLFLVHDRADQPFVKRLSSSLKEFGVEQVWVDAAEIPMGGSLLRKIEEGIDWTRYFGVVLSPRSIGSSWVLRELEQALDMGVRGKAVKTLPLLIENCDLPESLSGRIFADLTTDSSYDEAVRKLLGRLEKP